MENTRTTFDVCKHMMSSSSFHVKDLEQLPTKLKQ